MTFRQLDILTAESSDGYAVTLGTAVHPLVYTEGERKMVFGWTERTDERGVLHQLIVNRGSERWEPPFEDELITPDRRRVIISRLLMAAEFLGSPAEVVEATTWEPDGPSTVRTSAGQAVSRVGPTELRYRDELGRAMHIAVRDDAVAAGPYLVVELGSMARWQPPDEAVPLSDVEMAITMQRLIGALKAMGIESVMFVKPEYEATPAEAPTGRPPTVGFWRRLLRRTRG